MKLSIFTTVTEPRVRGDAWKPAFNCYKELADEFVVVDGSPNMTKDSGFSNPEMKVIVNKWPTEFKWDFIGQQFRRGYEACIGDWVIHADLDFIFHEKDFEKIREQLEIHREHPALSFWKYQFILPDRYNLKSRLVIAVNKKTFGDRIKFNSGGDLCQPSLDEVELSSDDMAEIRVPFYNYEHLLKTKEQITDDVSRMDRAYHRHFGKWLYSTDGTNAFDGWLEMVKGRFNKPQEHIKLSQHPKFVQETIKNLTPDQWGYNGFGLLEDNDYV